MFSITISRRFAYCMFFSAVVLSSLGGCNFFEHRPYYLYVDSSAGLGIQKMETVLPETKGVVRHEVSQMANDMWKNSGVWVESGQYVQIHSRGFWGCSVEHLGFHGPDGDDMDSAGRFPWCALLGKLGEQGEPFLVGRLCTFQAMRSGHLFFIMNDGIRCYDNNTGKMDIMVVIVPKLPDDIPAPLIPHWEEKTRTKEDQIPEIKDNKTPETHTDQNRPKDEVKPQDTMLIECAISLISIKTGAVDTEISAGCHGIGKVDAMASFLAQKLREKSMVRQERVGILDLKEDDSTTQNEHLGKTISQSLYRSLSQLEIYKLLPQDNVKRLIKEKGIKIESITDGFSFPEINELDYIITGKVTSLPEK